MSNIPNEAARIIYAITSEASHASQFTADQLALACRHLNAEYRAGRPMVSDTVYDQVFLAALRQAQPDHPFLHQVEPEQEGVFDAPTVRHEKPMLSTDKCYTQAEIESYIARCRKAYEAMGPSNIPLLFTVTPKLDGIAANDDGERIVTRGDGLNGSDVSHILARGLRTEFPRGLGRGELVVDQAFFTKHLGKGTQFDMDHPRNFVAGFVAADELKEHHRLAVAHGAIRFVPFSTLPEWTFRPEELLEQWQSLFAVVAEHEQVPYLTDGLVVAVDDPELREAMGATSHHERGVIAIKQQGETATSRVSGIRWTTGRTGRVIPTLLIDPVVLSGATVSKVTAHTAKNVVAKGLGIGAMCRFVRAGEVIPKVIDVITPAENVEPLIHCPSCNTPVVEDGEHAVCPNDIGCPAQAENRIRHWFHTLGNADLFGPKTVERLVAAGITELPAIYAMDPYEFTDLGFGAGQSNNLVEQLERSLREPVEEWRFLAAFGIKHLGRGDSRQLLDHFSFEELGFLTPEQIAKVPGFGTITSPAIATALNGIWPLVTEMRALGFRLVSEPHATQPSSSLLAGERIVFTGTMEYGSRSSMEAQARSLGADVQSAVNAKTTMLVAGANAGSKLKKAQANNEKAGKTVTRILTEHEYLGLLVDERESPPEPMATAI